MLFASPEMLALEKTSTRPEYNGDKNCSEGDSYFDSARAINFNDSKLRQREKTNIN